MRAIASRLRSFPVRCLTLGLELLLSLAALGRAQRTFDGTNKPPVLTSFSINTGVDTVSATARYVALVHASVGTPPAEYRVSRRADFAGAPWMPYEARLILRDWYDASGDACTVGTSLSGRRVTLYFQVRAALGEEVRIVNGQRQLQPARAESNVLRASICAVGSRPP
jgi:hypothetical protein